MAPAKQITVLLAEDHVLVRRGLCALLLADGRFKVVGEARTGREAINLAQTMAPDVIVMDIAMPLLNGLEAAQQILVANRDARVIILSGHTAHGFPERLKAIGVAGFLEKQTSAEVLTRAICEVARGRLFFGRDGTDHLQSSRAETGLRLTSREWEVLQLVAEGFANKQVAAELNLSIKTVEKHRQSLMGKLGIHDTAGLTRYAMAAGVIESVPQRTTR